MAEDKASITTSRSTADDWGEKDMWGQRITITGKKDKPSVTQCGKEFKEVRVNSLLINLASGSRHPLSFT